MAAVEHDWQPIVKDLSNYFPVIAEVFVPRGPMILVERVGDCAVFAPFLEAGAVFEAVVEYFPFSRGSFSSPTVRPGKPAASKYIEFPTT